MPPQGDFYRYECNVNFRYYYAVSPLRSLERLLKGTENAQSCTLAALADNAAFSASAESSTGQNGHNKRTPASAGVLEYRYLMESFLSGRSLANCRKFTAIT